MLTLGIYGRKTARAVSVSGELNAAGRHRAWVRKEADLAKRVKRGGLIGSLLKKDLAAQTGR